jgi:hypothetical protein
MEKAKLPSLETTNEQILSAEKAIMVSLKLQSGEINASALLILHPISYTLPNDAMGNGKSEVLFKK